jgi:hypothetical protein
VIPRPAATARLHHSGRHTQTHGLTGSSERSRVIPRGRSGRDSARPAAVCVRVELGQRRTSWRSRPPAASRPRPLTSTRPQPAGTTAADAALSPPRAARRALQTIRASVFLLAHRRRAGAPGEVWCRPAAAAVFRRARRAQRCPVRQRPHCRPSVRVVLQHSVTALLRRSGRSQERG